MISRISEEPTLRALSFWEGFADNNDSVKSFLLKFT